MVSSVYALEPLENSVISQLNLLVALRDLAADCTGIGYPIAV